MSVCRAAEPRVLWSLTNQQESDWFPARASFQPAVPYLLVWEGLRANSVLGVMGLDDITIFGGKYILELKILKRLKLA